MESPKSGSEYADLTIDANSSVNADMFFDPQKSHLYVMTQKKVRVDGMKFALFTSVFYIVESIEVSGLCVVCMDGLITFVS